jgi:hypothetical protein
LLLNGIANQAPRLKIKRTSGPPKKRTDEAFCGTGFSFSISFKASANGCKIPKKPVQFGPFRLCILAKTFLSKRVKNATVNITLRIRYKDNNTNQTDKLIIFKTI